MTMRLSLHVCILLLSAAVALSAGDFNGKGTASSTSKVQVEQNEKPATGAGADNTARTGQAKSTSDTPPPTRPFSGIATPVRDYPRVASSGRCGPLYRNGTRGSCIAEKPCRGYGIRDDKNEVRCMCYLTHGGCDAKSRCDDRAHACVADTRLKNGEE